MQVERGRPEGFLEGFPSGGRVSNTWVICPPGRDNRAKALLIPDKLTGAEAPGRKGEIRWGMSLRPIS